MTNSADANPDVAALTERFRKFGVLGASIIRDPGMGNAETAVKVVDKVQFDAKHATKEQLVAVLNDLADWHLSFRKAVTKLTNELYNHPNQSAMTFMEIYEKVAALGFTKNPAEEAGFSDSDLNHVTMKYQEDPEVCEAAENFMQSQAPSIDLTEFQKEAESIDTEKILKVHRAMNLCFQALVVEFSKIPEETRFTLTPRLVEYVAEVKVALESFNKFGYKAEPLEAAVALKQAELEKFGKFQQETQKLAETMKELYSFTKPRITRSELLKALVSVTEKSDALKALAKQLRKIPVLEGYAQFIAFTESQESSAVLSNPFEARDLFDRHLRSCTEAESKELKDAWEKSGLELSMFMQAVLMMQQDPSMGMPPPPPPAIFKKHDMPGPKEVMQMQEALVKELSEISQEILAVAPANFLAEPLVAFAQAMASAAVEEKFSVSSETLTLAGFKHGMALSSNERFVQVSQEQQRLLGEIAGAAPGGDGQTGCVVM